MVWYFFMFVIDVQKYVNMCKSRGITLYRCYFFYVVML